MTCLIVVSSKSGNTRLVADALASEAGRCRRGSGRPARARGGCRGGARRGGHRARRVLDRQGGLCAPTLPRCSSGSAVSVSFSLARRLWRERGVLCPDSRPRARPPARDATYLGGAMCQGKMGAGVRARYEAMLAEHPGDERIRGMIDNFDAGACAPRRGRSGAYRRSRPRGPGVRAAAEPAHRVAAEASECIPCCMGRRTRGPRPCAGPRALHGPAEVCEGAWRYGDWPRCSALRPAGPRRRPPRRRACMSGRGGSRPMDPSWRCPPAAPRSRIA